MSTPETPDTIYLFDMGPEGIAWCGDPAPGTGMDPADAVEYVRADLVEALTRDVNALRAAASCGPVTSREIFRLTDPMADRLARAALAAGRDTQ